MNHTSPRRSKHAAVEHVYPVDQFKEGFKQSLKSNRSGKILFKFGIADVVGFHHAQVWKTPRQAAYLTEG